MAWPVVIATNGIGIPVTEVPDGPRGGVPYEIAANGFGTPVVFVANGGTPVTGGAVSLPLDFTVPPLAFYGTARLAGYAGNAMTIRRANGNTQAIGFVNDRVDMAARNTFAGGADSFASVRIWPDQSGNGYDITQTIDGAQPLFYESQDWADTSFLGLGPNFVLNQASLAVASNNHAVLMLLRSVSSRVFDPWIYWGGTSSFSFGTINPDNPIIGGLRVRDQTGAVNKVSARVPRSEPVIVGYSSGADDVMILLDGAVETFAGGLAARTMTGLQISNSNGFSEIAAIAVFNRALTEAELIANG